jgi:hypothetical protein
VNPRPEWRSIAADDRHRLATPADDKRRPWLGLSHGVGLAAKHPHVATWMPLAMGWLAEQVLKHTVSRCVAAA